MHPKRLFIAKDLLTYALWISVPGLLGMAFGHFWAGLCLGLGLALTSLLCQLNRISKIVVSGKGFTPQPADASRLLSSKSLDELVLYLQRELVRYHKRASGYMHTIRQHNKLLGKLPYGIVVISKNGGIRSSNLAARRMLGLQPSDTMRVITMFVRSPAFVEFFERGVYGTRLTFSLSNTSLSSIAPTILEVARMRYAENDDLLLFADVTERVQKLHMHKRFLADSSHELQTPLTIIRGNAELAQQTKGKKRRNYLAKIIEQVDSAAGLMRSLMLLAKIDESMQPDSLVWIHPKRTIQLASQAALREIGEECKIVLKLEIDPQLELYINPGDLFSIVRNLLSNALKNSPKGSRIWLAWRLGNWQHKPGGKTYAMLEVADKGCGIAKDELDKITRRFYQIRTPGHSGTGLGLSIVKGLLNLYRAKLLIESRRGKGSRFGCAFGSRHYRIAAKQPDPTAVPE